MPSSPLRAACLIVLSSLPDVLAVSLVKATETFSVATSLPWANADALPHIALGDPLIFSQTSGVCEYALPLRLATTRPAPSRRVPSTKVGGAQDQTGRLTLEFRHLKLADRAILDSVS